MFAVSSTMPISTSKPTPTTTLRPLPTPLPTSPASSSSSILSLASISSTSSAPSTLGGLTVSEKIDHIKTTFSNSLGHKEFRDTVIPEQERLRALDAARGLVSALETPFERVWQLTAALPALNAALKVARDVRLFELWEENEEGETKTVRGKGEKERDEAKSARQLAALTGVDEDLMPSLIIGNEADCQQKNHTNSVPPDRLLRHMAATHVIEAVAPGVYRQTAFTRAMQGKGPGSWIDEHDELIAPIFSHLPAFLASRGYIAPDSATDAVFQAVKPLAYPAPNESTSSSTLATTNRPFAAASRPDQPTAMTEAAPGYTVFEYWARHPAEAATFTEAMGSFTNAKDSWFDWFPVDELLDSDEESFKEREDGFLRSKKEHGPVAIHEDQIPMEDNVNALSTNMTTAIMEMQNLNHVLVNHQPDLSSTTIAANSPGSSTKPQQSNPNSLPASPASTEASTPPSPSPSAPAVPVIVDIGGNIGRDIDALLRRFPHIPADRTVLLDRPEVVAQATCDAGVRRVGHDFFEPLPESLHGARIYYLHAVLHDWPTADARRILAHIRSAMQRAGPGRSRLILNEWVLRDGASDRDGDGTSGSGSVSASSVGNSRDPAPLLPSSRKPESKILNATNKNNHAVSSPPSKEINPFVDSDAATTCDLIMMAALGARERTEAEWRQLLASEGFRVSRVGFAPGCGDGVVEAVLV